MTPEQFKRVEELFHDAKVLPPDEVGECVVRGIQENAAYVFTHPEFGAIFEPRLQAIREALAASAAPRSGVTSPADFR